MRPQEQAASGRAKPGRIGPLDTFRYLTVTFALISHALLEIGVEAVVSEQGWLTIRSITRTATPCLLFLFGVMGEVVYARRWAEMGGAVAPRLYHRAFQCYVAFVVLAALVVISRPEPLSYMLRSFGFLTLEGYNVIFALYFFLLLALVPALALRHRWGLPGLSIIPAAVWIIHILVLPAVPIAHPFVSTLGDVTIGNGGIWGPSAFHSLTLVIAGMVFGNLLYRQQHATGAGALSSAFVLLSLAVIAFEMMRLGVGGFFAAIVDLSTYRAQNHPAYYAYGILGSLLMVGVAYAVYRISPRRLLGHLNGIGGKTFSYFFIGNALIIVLPAHAVTSLVESVLLISAFIVCSGLLTLGWARLSRRWGVGTALTTVSYRQIERMASLHLREGDDEQQRSQGGI